MILILDLAENSSVKNSKLFFCDFDSAKNLYLSLRNENSEKNTGIFRCFLGGAKKKI